MSPAAPAAHDASPLALRDVLRAWWPLAASWTLMGLELPLFSAAVARLPNAEVNLAAHGGVVFPLALIIESPIMMLLAAGTALARDEASFRLLRRFMMLTGAALTILHALIAFTPLFDFVARPLLGAPDAILEPARLGLRVMLPWTWSIAYRRFHQGLLIRFGQTRPVALGTLIRLIANLSMLALGSAMQWPGIVVGTAGLATAVLAEATFVRIWAARVIRGPLRDAPAVAPALTMSAFLHFYVPLALTQVLSLGAPPLTAAAVARMPDALTSLAAWPAATGLSFMLRGSSFALHEIVVSLLDRPGARATLRRFAMFLGIATGAALLAIGATPLGAAWFGVVSDLPPHVAALAMVATLAGVLHPPLTALENWYQGQLVHAHRTRVVTWGMAIYLGTLAGGLALALGLTPWPGLVTATLLITVATAAKVLWLRRALR